MILGSFLIVTSGFTFLGWKRGTPYQEPYWSPNGKYYVQKYANFTPRQLLAVMPGQGSDMIDGYIRVYDRQGILIKEQFHIFIRDIEPIWFENEVFFMGAENLGVWKLPSSTQ